jgi:DNA polymerase-3 subunit delta
MENPKPTVYLLSGDNDLAFEEFIVVIRENLGDPTTADMNTQRFSSTEISLGALEEACYAMPFLSSRRLVILDHAERLPKEDDWQDRFFTLLDSLPETIALVIIDHVDTQSMKKVQAHEKKSPLHRWAREHEGKVYTHVRETDPRPFDIPRGAKFISWIKERSRSMGGEIETTAAQLLSDSVAGDPHSAVQELTKLLDYTDRQRPIDRNDVELLTAFRGQGDIFEMVDAMGQRQGKSAQMSLHRILVHEDIRPVFGMIVRQFRLMIMAREALEQGSDVREAFPAGTPKFVMEKISSQSRNFSLSDLESIYRMLLEIDIEAKTSGMDLETALDSLIVRLSR